MMQRALEEARKAGADATLSLDESRNVELNYEFNRLKSIQNTETLSYAAQAIKGGHLGVARSTKAEGGADVMNKAIRLTEYGAPVAYAFPEPLPASKPSVYSEKLAGLSLEQMIEAGRDITEFLKALHPDVNGCLRFTKSVQRSSIANTNGLCASWERTVLNVLTYVTLAEGQNLVDIYDFHSSTDFDWNIEKTKEEIGAKFELARKIVPIETGIYDVLFTPRGFGDLISPILACLDGKAVARKVSPFAGRLGDQAFSPKLTIVEDGSMDGGVGSRMYDGQGVACRRTSLIDKGVISEYLLDLDSAQKLGREPIGTGGIGGIEPNNLLVDAGDTSKDDLLAGIKRGIIIDATMGAWAGNPYSGQVSGNISMGFLVVDGKPVGRVRDCMFSANAFTHLKDHLAALSRETKSMWGISLPYALVRNVSVTAKTK